MFKFHPISNSCCKGLTIRPLSANSVGTGQYLDSLLPAYRAVHLGRPSRPSRSGGFSSTSFTTWFFRPAGDLPVHPVTVRMCPPVSRVRKDGHQLVEPHLGPGGSPDRIRHPAHTHPRPSASMHCGQSFRLWSFLGSFSGRLWILRSPTSRAPEKRPSPSARMKHNTVLVSVQTRRNVSSPSARRALAETTRAVVVPVSRGDAQAGQRGRGQRRCQASAGRSGPGRLPRAGFGVPDLQNSILLFPLVDCFAVEI